MPTTKDLENYILETLQQREYHDGELLINCPVEDVQKMIQVCQNLKSEFLRRGIQPKIQPFERTSVESSNLMDLGVAYALAVDKLATDLNCDSTQLKTQYLKTARKLVSDSSVEEMINFFNQHYPTPELQEIFFREEEDED